MNVLFLTVLGIDSIYRPGMYEDLLREFVNNDHEVFVISPIERRFNQTSHVIKEEHATIVRPKMGNYQKTNIVEKGLTTIYMDILFQNTIKKYFEDVVFDLVLYSTPPITTLSAIEYIKNRDGAKSYLLLKDIFPQNAVDLGMMTTSGPKSILYKYFRRKEKKLYAISDRIGCMSPANVKYVLDHNPELNPDKVEVCPNAIEVIDKSVDYETRIAIRNKYGIPLDKTVFVYGGNLGKPQGIPFLIDCLKEQHNENAYFLIVGDGTEYSTLEEYVNGFKPTNVRLMKRLPKEDYDLMVASCDVGMVILDHRFTIPNFPSRLLSYMQAKLPVLVCADQYTDIGQIVESGGYGWFIESVNESNFVSMIDSVLSQDLSLLGANAFRNLIDNYSVEQAYSTIV